MSRFNELIRKATEFRRIGTKVQVYSSNINGLYAIDWITKISKHEIVVSTSELPQVGLPEEYRNYTSFWFELSTIEQIEGTDL